MDAILQLEYDPKLNKTNEYTHEMLGVEPEELSVQQWKSFAHHWRSYNETSMPTQAYCFHMNEVFVNPSDKNGIYPLTTEEIAEAQRADVSLKHLFKRNAVIDQGLERIKLIEHDLCLQGWLADYPQAAPGACSQIVSPLPIAPWTHTS